MSKLIWRVADGRERIGTTLTMPPGYDTAAEKDVLSIPLTTMSGTGMVDASSYLAKAGTKLQPTASTKVTEGVLNSPVEFELPGLKKFEGNFSVLRPFDVDTDDIDATLDVLFTQIGEDNITFYAYKRLGKLGTVPWAVGDEGYVYECLTDVAIEQPEQNQATQATVPLSVISRRAFKITS
ncbi:MAG: hypothetical protein FWG25_11265 [Promicromonosporaceae bacterium]|nr:hypothetical protein [Promicromonosporaceae bacterium]